MAERSLARPLIAALPLTVVPGDGELWLVGGEDLRWSIEGPAVERWLPEVLKALDGERTVAEVVSSLDGSVQRHATDVVLALEEERVLIEAPHGPPAATWIPSFVGDPLLVERLSASAMAAENAGPNLVVHAQRTLDYAEARRVAREAADQGNSYLWVTLGPRTRAFVSPVFAPGRGPCVGCLHGAFRRLSPIPELYELLDSHSATDGEFASADVASPFMEAVVAHVAWKLALFDEPLVPSAPYRLHVLEWITGEVSSHPVRVDPDCVGQH